MAVRQQFQKKWPIAISLIVFVRKNGSPDTHLVIITMKKTINPLVTDLLYLIWIANISI